MFKSKSKTRIILKSVRGPRNVIFWFAPASQNGLKGKIRDVKRPAPLCRFLLLPKFLELLLEVFFLCSFQSILACRGSRKLHFGDLGLTKNDFVFGRLWHSPFIFSFSCLGYRNEIYDIGTEILLLTKSDHNSTQKAPKSIIPQEIKSAGHSPSSDSFKARVKVIFKKVTFLDSQVPWTFAPGGRLSYEAYKVKKNINAECHSEEYKLMLN